MRAVTLSSALTARSFVSSVALVRSSGVPRSAEVLNNTIPLRRLGASIAILGATNPPQEVPKATAGARTPVASRTWTAASAHSSMVKPRPGPGLRPWPGGSSARVRQPASRKGAI